MFFKIGVLRTATSLKKRLWRSCFPVNSAKFLGTSFYKKTPPVAVSFIAITGKHLLCRYWHSVGNLLSYSNLKTLLNLHGLLISFLAILEKKRKEKFSKPICSQCTLSLPTENIKKTGFLMVSGGRERVHWEQMGGLTDFSTESFQLQ